MAKYAALPFEGSGIVRVEVASNDGIVRRGDAQDLIEPAKAAFEQAHCRISELEPAL